VCGYVPCGVAGDSGVCAWLMRMRVGGRGMHVGVMTSHAHGHVSPPATCTGFQGVVTTPVAYDLATALAPGAATWMPAACSRGAGSVLGSTSLDSH
jgi:hypothetical protein